MFLPFPIFLESPFCIPSFLIPSNLPLLGENVVICLTVIYIWLACYSSFTIQDEKFQSSHRFQHSLSLLSRSSNRRIYHSWETMGRKGLGYSARLPVIRPATAVDVPSIAWIAALVSWQSWSRATHRVDAIAFPVNIKTYESVFFFSLFRIPFYLS